MMTFTSMFSQLERKTIAERIRDNMHELAKAGRWLGGAPTSYTLEAVKTIMMDGKSKRACDLKAFFLLCRVGRDSLDIVDQREG